MSMDEQLARIGETLPRVPAPPPEDRPGLLELVGVTEEDEAAALDVGHERRRGEWLDVVPPKFATATMGDLDDQMRTDLLAWTQQPTNLLLVGATGVGKSHAALAAARRVFMRGRGVVYWPMVTLLDELHWQNPDSTTILRDACRAPVLVLDDLGADKLTDWALGRVGRLACERWDHDLPTVVTTNLEPPQLREAVGDRVYSRLADDALAIHVGGVDRRLAR